MANQMKKRPMQKQAERLAAQGRFGDTMLVHMNPVEVEGIASLVPGGKLTKNPQTGQPEAFWPIIAAAAGAIKGGLDARKQKKAAKKRTAAIEERQRASDQFTKDQLSRIGSHSAFNLPKTLADMDPSEVSFLPKGASQGFNLNYQNTPGTMFANYQAPNPFAMGDLPRQVVQQPVMQEPPADEDAGTVDTGSEDVAGLGPDLDQLEMINASRKKLGFPEFKSMEDFYDFISDITEGGPAGPYGGGIPFMMANEGGLASLPVYMSEGGEGQSGAGGIGSVISRIGSALGGMGGMGSEDVDFENMTKEELIEYIKSLSSGGSGSGVMDAVGRDSGGKPGYAPTAGGGLSDYAGMFSKGNVAKLLGKADGGLMASPVHMARGGEGFANLGAHIASAMPAFSGARQLGMQVQGKMKGDLGQMGTTGTGSPGYNTVGTEEYESRQRPVQKFLSRMRARQQARQSAREARRAEKPSEGQQESRPRITGLADRIQSFKDRQANKAEARDAANAYARSMGVPEAQRGGFPARIAAFDERMNQRIRDRFPIVGQGVDFLEGRGGLTDRVLENRPVLSFFKRGLGFNDGGIASLSGYADGDMVEDFPRMNGPISGPGTETSDDIPAMLSDGEFVVNAKAVRGIGRMNGANKSKEEQRREGARMMYQLQRAGEQAMRRS